MDIYELMETVVFVPAEQADQEGLPCLYCSGDVEPGQRLRDTAHEPCAEAADRYAVATDSL